MVIFSKRFPGGLEVSSLRKLTRVVKGEDAMSGLYGFIADGIMALGSTLYAGIFQP